MSGEKSIDELEAHKSQLQKDIAELEWQKQQCIDELKESEHILDKQIGMMSRKLEDLKDDVNYEYQTRQYCDVLMKRDAYLKQIITISQNKFTHEQRIELFGGALCEKLFVADKPKTFDYAKGELV